MQTARAYKSLCPVDKQFLSDTAKEVAVLVKAAKKMRHVREQVREFGERWKAYKMAQDADLKGEWQRSMGRPDNPLDGIWPRSAAPGQFPSFGGDAGARAPYALLAIIHDKMLPKCPAVAKGILPKKLVDEIWRALVTGANLENTAPTSPDATNRPRRAIPTTKIKALLREVKADNDNRRDIQATITPSGFEFNAGQALYGGVDLKLPSGLPVDVLPILFKNMPRTVPYKTLDLESGPHNGSDQLRSAVVSIRKALKKRCVPYRVDNKRGEGYCLQRV